MTDPFATYVAIRDRMLDLARSAPDPATRIPSCPEWQVNQLLTHCSSLPAAISVGDLPTGDVDEWIAGLLAAREGWTIDRIEAEWRGADDTIAAMVGGGGGMLLDDLMVHEHDLRGAIDRPDHDAFDCDMFVPRSLESCVAQLEARGLGAIEVVDGDRSWVSHDAPIGWTMRTSAWESVRFLYSRRTPDEIRTIGGSDRIDDYIALLDDHLPLPIESLGERR